MSGDPISCEMCTRNMLTSGPIRPLFEPQTPAFQNRPQTVVVQYPYPPIVQMENGEYYEMPDPYTLVQLVYSMRERINELERRKE